MLLMGLRLREGVSLRALAERSGFALPSDRLEELEADGLLHADEPDRIAVTAQGRLVLNALIADLAGSLEPRAGLVPDARGACLPVTTA
jgi:coproporphyrinogen III oxidase-like Fe-S oxidoreductase